MSFIKENIFTIVLVFLIVVVLFVMSFFIYKIVIEHSNNNTDIEEIPNINISNNSKKEKNDNVLQVENSESEESEERQFMLNRIANIFNNCTYSKGMVSQGYSTNAIATQDDITVHSSGSGVSFDVDFKLDNNILYTKILYNQNEPRITAVKILLATILVDCIGQEKGYAEGTLYRALSDEASLNYTIDNEGIETKQIDNSYDLVIKVDLNSNFPFLNT